MRFFFFVISMILCYVLVNAGYYLFSFLLFFIGIGIIWKNPTAFFGRFFDYDIYYDNKEIYHKHRVKKRKIAARRFRKKKFSDSEDDAEHIRKGEAGEREVSICLAKLPKHEYQVYKNLLLPTSHGDTTQIDHVVFSRYGIFVIEVKNFGGWIFAREKDRVWTQVWRRQRHTFQNPLRQNYKHVKTLQELTGLHEQVFYNFVIFAGNAEFKTEIPDNVFVWRNKSSDFFISKHRDILLSESQINDAIVAALGNTRQFEENAHKDHVSRLRARHK